VGHGKEGVQSKKNESPELKKLKEAAERKSKGNPFK